MSAACTAAPTLGMVEATTKRKELVAGPGGDFRAPGIRLPRKIERPVVPRPSPYTLAGQVEGEVDERFHAVALELQPRTVLGTYFARRIAVGMVRTERAERHDAAMLAFRQRHAAEAFDRARQEAAQAALRRLDGDDPRAARAARRELLAMPEGVDLLIERILNLRAQAGRDEPEWGMLHEDSLRHACGWRDEELNPTRGWTLAKFLMGDARLISPEDRAAATAAPRFAAWVGRALAQELTGEIDRLREHRATLDHESIAHDRAEAPERAALDPGRASTLAERYEARAAREVRQSLDALMAVEAAAALATLAPPAPEPAADSASDTPATPGAEPIEEDGYNVGSSFPVIDLSAVLGSFGTGSARFRPVAPAAHGAASRHLEPGVN